MRKSFLSLVPALCVAVIVVALRAVPGMSQNTSSGGAKEERWSGTVIRSNDKAMTLTVRKEGQNMEKIVHYNSSTKWTEGAKEGVKNIEPSEIKEGDRVICLGNTDAKGQFVATRIDKRKPGKGAFKEQ